MKGEVTPLTGEEILDIHRGVELDCLQWLPDSSGIVFRGAFSGTSDLYRVEADGGPICRLTVRSGATTPRVSPSGRWLAYLSKRSGDQEVWLHRMSGGGPHAGIQLTSLGAEVNALNWSPDGQSMVVSCNRFGTFDVYEVEVPSGRFRCLTNDAECYEHYPVYSPDGETILFVRLNASWEDHQIVKISRDGSGERIIAEDFDFFDYQIGRRFGHPLVAPDGRRLLFRSHRSNWINYWCADADGSGDPVPIYPEEHDQAAESGSITAGEACWSPDGRFVAHVSNHDGNIRLRVTSMETGNSEVIAAEREGVATHPAWSPDGRKIAFLYQDFTSPPDVWVATVSAETGGIVVGEKKQLTFSMPEELAGKFNRPQKIRYCSFDGLSVSAYVYRPENAPDGPCPAILEVHGGPVDQFRDTMHVVVQYYVQRGYTVMMCNIRGSAGYGKEFEEGISNGWGADDLRDLVEGARWLVRERLAIPDRIGITGQSYGGFMSMAAACFAPRGVFQASISRTGYADWGHYYREGGQRTVKLLRHSMGPMEDNEERYRENAPMLNAGRAVMPILIVDQETPAAEPNPGLRAEFAGALGAANKPVKYRKYESTGGPYARSRPGATQLLADMMEFFDTYLRREG